jgi:glycosyltransferase involved in cell wall biosynthesis
MIAADMRILALIGAVHPFGSERGNLEVLSALKAKGAEVLVVVNNADYAFEMRDYARARGFEIAEAPMISLPRWYSNVRPMIDLPLGIVRASLAFLKIHRAFRPTHIHACQQLFVLNFLLGLMLVRTPMVYRSGARRAARMGVVSRFIAAKAVAAGVEEDKITVIYSRPPERAPLATPMKKTTTFDIAFVGQVIEGKGVGVLVEAFKRVIPDFPKARLFIAGRIWEDWAGETWGKDLRDTTMADPALAGKIHFLGFTEKVPELLATSRIFCAPTLTEEPMGNVVMEAKAASLASIIFRSGGFPEVIEHGKTGFVCEEKTADALEAALRFYLQNPAEADRQGKAAKASLKDYGVDEFAERWERIYSEAAR